MKENSILKIKFSKQGKLSYKVSIKSKVLKTNRYVKPKTTNQAILKDKLSF